MLSRLSAPAYFNSFTLDPFTIDWHNKIAFAPEYLYEIGRKVSSDTPYPTPDFPIGSVAEPWQEYIKKQVQ